ncbi:P-loop containing nucleoside triphosphate hydrolase protein [Mariannaea sp. PMI_226]|nr:P-loop containing nucleoside triphosphate hydrolase protein [Mariannaea sp. PMI_226]
MAATRRYQQRNVSHSQFDNNTIINQGNIQGNVHYHLPHQPARSEVVRIIPYPRNEDMIHRPDPIERLDKLLPQTSGFYSAALWGLGGSGKTQIALDYAYRRCDNDSECCVFWVHADNEATFISDYKTIAKKLGVDERLDGSDLLDAVRSNIEAQPQWVIIFDNADDLGLFGVGRTGGRENETLRKYIPRASQGTILWTSRDAHIAGTLVGSRRGIEVRSMTADEATSLLARVRDEESTFKEVGVDALLDELQCLPLAISQAGAYIRRMSMTIEEYLSLLRQGNTRWDVLKISDFDQHRRPEVSNSVLETWRSSIERIRAESKMSYRILHVVAYVDGQDIPHELMAAAASRVSDKDSAGQATDLEVQQAIMRLNEFSFLSLRRKEDGERSYEMYKLVQEAVRYGLWVRGRINTALGEKAGRESGLELGEAYYSNIALRIVDELFPVWEGKPWTRCEQYIAHAIRVGDWAEVNGNDIKTSRLLRRVSSFLYDQGRWREKEPVDERAWGLWREALGEKHPDTISSIASLATMYYEQGRYDEAEVLHKTALDLCRHVLGDDHPDTTQSVIYLASTQESLQQTRSLIRPFSILAIKQVRDSEERKPHRRSLGEIIGLKVGFRKWRSHKRRGSD